MPKNPTRRDVIAGTTAAIAAAAALPLLPAALVVSTSTARSDLPVELWPMDTREEREMVIVRALKTHIAKTEGRAERSVTTKEIYRFVRNFGMSHDDLVAAVQRIKAREQAMLHATASPREPTELAQG